MVFANIIVSIKFFRILLSVQDEFYIKHLAEKGICAPILDGLIQTLPRDNLLSSASLDFFEFIKKENLKELVKHLVDNHRDTLVKLSYMPTFKEIIFRYDQTQGYTSNMDYFLETEDDMARKPPPTGRLMNHLEDPTEEEYWNTPDADEEEEQNGRIGEKTPATNGSATPSKPLVDYPSDEEADENVDPEAKSQATDDDTASQVSSAESSLGPGGPPERLSEKRRREEDDEDEMDKLMHNKRRNSSSSSNNSAASAGMARRRKSFTAGSGNGPPKKIAISLSPAVRTGNGSRSDEDS